MKKLIPIFLLCLVANRSISQNLDDINDLMGLFKNREAKAAIDKYLSNPKKVTDADGWYMKGRIYNALSRDTGVTVVESYELKIEAFKAFQENQKLDKKDIRMALEEHVSYFDLYSEMYNNGIINYNSKNYQGAYQGFKMANEIKDFILSKKYKNENMQLVAFDTSLIMNIAICAMSAKNEPEAIIYYTKLTDANVSGKEFQEVYQYLIDYYNKNKNEKSFNELLSKAKQLYPGDEIWVEIELKAVEEKGGKKALIEKYDELTKQNPSNFVYAYNYAVELYNCLYGKDATNVGDSVIGAKLKDVLNKAIVIEDKKDVTALMLMCTHLFYQASDLNNNASAIKGPNPDQLKKKAAMKAAAMKVADECISNALKVETFFDAIPTKSKAQKLNYKLIIGNLSDLYYIKKNQLKIDEYEKKNKTADEDYLKSSN
jgi:hypothetical protein